MKIGAFNVTLYIGRKQFIPVFTTFFDDRVLNSVQGDLHIMLFSTGEFRENRCKEGYNFYGYKLKCIYNSTRRIKTLRFVHKERHMQL